MFDLAQFLQRAEEVESTKADLDKSVTAYEDPKADKAGTYAAWVVCKKTHEVAKSKLSLAVQLLQASYLWNKDPANVELLKKDEVAANLRTLEAVNEMITIVTKKRDDLVSLVQARIDNVAALVKVLQDAKDGKDGETYKTVRAVMVDDSNDVPVNLAKAHLGLSAVYPDGADRTSVIKAFKKATPSVFSNWSKFKTLVEDEYNKAKANLDLRNDNKNKKDASTVPRNFDGYYAVKTVNTELRTLEALKAKPSPALEVPVDTNVAADAVYRSVWAAFNKLTSDNTDLKTATDEYVKKAALWKAEAKKALETKQQDRLKKTVLEWGDRVKQIKKEKEPKKTETQLAKKGVEMFKKKVQQKKVDTFLEVANTVRVDPVEPQNFGVLAKATMEMQVARVELAWQYGRQKAVEKAVTLAKGLKALTQDYATDAEKMKTLFPIYEKVNTLIGLLNEDYKKQVKNTDTPLKTSVTGLQTTAGNLVLAGAVGPVSHALRQLFSHRREPTDKDKAGAVEDTFPFVYAEKIQISPKEEFEKFADKRYGVTSPQSIKSTLGEKSKPDPEWKACAEFTSVWKKVLEEQEAVYGENKAAKFEESAATGYQQRCVHALTMRNYYPALPSECVHWKLAQTASTATSLEPLAPQGYSTFVLALLSTLTELGLSAGTLDPTAAAESFHPVAEAVETTVQFGTLFTRLFLPGADTMMQSAFQAALEKLYPLAQNADYSTAVAAMSAATAPAMVLRRQFFAELYDQVVMALISGKMHTDAHCGMVKDTPLPQGAQQDVVIESQKFVALDFNKEIDDANKAADTLRAFRLHGMKVRPRFTALKMVAVEAMSLSGATITALFQARPARKDPGTKVNTAKAGQMFPLPADGYADWADLSKKCSAWDTLMSNGNKGLDTSVPDKALRSEHDRFIAALKRDKQFAWAGAARAAKEYVKASYGPDSVMSLMFEKSCGAYTLEDSRSMKSLRVTPVPNFWTEYPEIKHE